ncbi:hypothetical protein LSH36_10g03075 [Paralvinella palmiformis]|uniref:Ima1 N-terminal domain-containing protein n=1 Tax=Paralvinella palmiformis TaxID=53620 RepID=A0AAD9NJF3_9ANNE|nr:hypothetical protein LSH36_10g03075 [Paralvinella palmiformis]
MGKATTSKKNISEPKSQPRFPVTVNCWFCNANTKVPYGNRNCWDCPSCEQYNGFSEDGDYNKPIPAQFVEEFNYPVTPIQQSDSFHSSSDVLCLRCQQNQDLKIRQLANFLPYSEATFDYEMEAYKRHLEQMYKLCRWCEQNVYDVLDRQDRVLRKQHKHMECQANSSQDDSMNASLDKSNTAAMTPGFLIHLLRWISLVFSLAYSIISVKSLLVHVNNGSEVPLPSLLNRAFMNLSSSRVPVLVLLGLLSAIISVQMAGKEQLQLADTSMCVFWLLGLFLSAMSSCSSIYGYQLARLTISLATVIMVIWSVMTPRFHKRSRRRIRTVKCRPSPDANQVTSTTNRSGENDHISLLAPEDDNVGSSSDGDCFSDFETMSIGSASELRRHKPDIFTSYTNKVSIEPTVTSSTSPYLRRQQPNSLQRQPVVFSLRQQRPIIIPAKFKPSSLPKPRPLMFDESRPTTSKTMDFSSGDNIFGSTKWTGITLKDKPLLFAPLTGGGGVASSVSSERGSLFSEPRNPCSDSDDQISEETRTHASRTSGDTSICPVDTTSHSVVDHGGVLSHTTVPAQLNNTSKMISPFYAIHLLAQKLI